MSKVKVTHWWPGREFEGPSPIPVYLIENARKKGTKYLSYARYQLPDGRTVDGLAECNPIDTPSRAMGRAIALGRLWKATLKLYETGTYADEAWEAVVNERFIPA